MRWEFFLIFIVLGSFIGCFASLLGVGGGVFIVPTLYWIFIPLLGQTPYNMQMAITTSLAVMVATSIFAIYFHAKKKTIDWKTFYLIGIGMVLGALVGSYLAHKINSSSLKVIFGVVEIAIALFLLFYKRPEKQIMPTSPRLTNFIMLTFVGFFTSLVGAFLGIGGGIFIVPFLIITGHPIAQAVGTSAATIIFTSLTATIALLLSSYNLHLPYSFGYIYLPAAFGLTIGSLIGTPIGVKLVHKLKEQQLKKIFIFVLVAIGILMII